MSLNNEDYEYTKMQEWRTHYKEHKLPTCSLSGSGRGDCEHFVGLPGKSIPGQHDGKDDTVDCYGKPNGWCWNCWNSYRICLLKRRVTQLEDILLKELGITPPPVSH